MIEVSKWWGRGRRERFGEIDIEPAAPSQPVAAPTPNKAETKIGKPKPLRPGERIEKEIRKQARELRQPSETAQPRKKRDYDALIARAIEDLQL
jgi:hypothetical protein